VYVRHPLSRLAAVIEVEHGGDGVDAQAIDVVAVEPEERVALEKVGDLPPAVVIDQCIPVLVKPAAWVLVLIERRTIEAHKAVRVARKMRRHPVQDHPDAGLMETFNEPGKLLWRPEARCWREQTYGLVSP
jgi:hypothetical protein